MTSAARLLVLERGADGSTIDEVVELANVSPRTFFNYFDSKESAIIGVDQGPSAMLVSAYAIDRRREPSHRSAKRVSGDG